MPINAHPEFLAAEKEYLNAHTTEERIEKLKKMISLAPGHKGAENLRAQLKTRLKKLQQQIEKSKKSKGTTKKGIKKGEMQAAIIGFTNSGKSTLLTQLTNSKPLIAEYAYSTTEPILGTLKYTGTNIQLIEIPAIESEYYDKGIVNTTDTIIILVKNFEQIKEIEKILEKSIGKKIIAFNLMENQSSEQIRKIKETLKSKRYKDFVIINTKTNYNLDIFQDLLFKSFNKIRIYTKEPEISMEKKSNRPIILNPESTIKEAAEKILKGFSSKIIQTRIWGPSSKFPGQKVSLKHQLKDLDTLEFKTR